MQELSIPASLLGASAPLAIELCSGSGSMLKSFRDLGWRVLGLDHQYNRFSPQVITIQVDLSTPEGQRQAWRWVSLPAARFVASGPPCGTATRALELPDGPVPIPQP